MFRSRRISSVSAIAMAIILSISALGGTCKADDLMEIVPAQSLFCVRVNNFDYAIGQVDQFISGLSPIPVSLAMMARGGLAQAIGDPMLANVNTRGNFAIFGTTSADGGIVLAAVIPVTDYAKFVEENANCSAADESGISTISVNGPDSPPRAILVKIDGFALVTQPGKNAQLLALADSVNSGGDSLAGRLDESELERSTAEPFWAYGSVAQAAPIVKPLVAGGLEEIRSSLQQLEGQPGQPPIEMDKIIGMYAAIIDMALDEIDYVSIAIKPDAEAIRINYAIEAKDNTTMAKMFATNPSEEEIGLLGYLKDGQAMNLAFRNDKEASKFVYDALFDVFETLIGDSIEADEMQRLKDLTLDSIDAMGNSVVFSLKAGEGKPPFEFIEVIEIDDVQAYKAILKEEYDLADEGLFNDLYKGFGLDMDLKMESGVDSYKDVSIDSVKVVFNQTGENPDMDAVINAIYGDSLAMSSAITNGKYLIAMAGDSDAGIRELIDQTKADPDTIGGEMQDALELLEADGSEDLIGTLNILRFMQMQMDVAKGIVPEGETLPQFTGTSSSNVAFSGSSYDGRCQFKLVVPKAHVIEIKNAAEAAMMPPQQPE